jgi:uncharacterized protein (DUF58 family)
LKNLQEIYNSEQFKNIDFIANQLVEGFITGLHRSPYHGFSVEFAEHRIYNTGESIKHIDWKLFAKTEKLFVKRYEEETNLRCQIIIDTSSSMQHPIDKDINKLNFSVYSAAALINLLKRQRDAVGLSLLSDQIEFHINAKLSVKNNSLIYSKLEDLLNYKKKNKGTKISTLLHDIAEMIHKRSLIIIFTDMLEYENINEMFEALNHLKFNQNEIVIFHLSDKKSEFEFDYQNRPHKFIDLETESEIKLSPNEVKQMVENKFVNYYNEVKLKCGRYKIDLMEIDINENISDVLTSYLIKRQSML